MVQRPATDILVVQDQALLYDFPFAEAGFPKLNASDLPPCGIGSNLKPCNMTGKMESMNWYVLIDMADVTQNTSIPSRYATQYTPHTRLRSTPMQRMLYSVWRSSALWTSPTHRLYKVTSSIALECTIAASTRQTKSMFLSRQAIACGILTTASYGRKCPQFPCSTLIRHLTHPEPVNYTPPSRTFLRSASPSSTRPSSNPLKPGVGSNPALTHHPRLSPSAHPGKYSARTPLLSTHGLSTFTPRMAASVSTAHT